VPAERIAENLAFINWTVLTGLAIGSFVAVVLARMRTDATRGFLAFTAACAVVLGVLAVLSDQALPVASSGSPIRIDPAFDQPRRVALAAFTVLAGVYVVALTRRHRAPWIAAAGLFAAAATLVFGALAWAGGTVFAVPLLLQLVVLAIATGGVFAAMILGHWYLVTPKLPEAPLILISRGLLAVVALQVVLFAVWVSTGTGPGVGAGPFSVLVGPWALFVWLRLIVGLIFPLVVSWAALQTARSRSMESATGLLYINVGTIAAGTILAAGLYFGAGLLV
jgi:hypothetical protein